MEEVARELRRIARAHKTVRADLEHLMAVARDNARDGMKAGLVVAPSRPAEAAPEEPEPPRRPRRAERAPAREPRVPPRQPRVPPREPRVPPRSTRAARPARVELTEPRAPAPLPASRSVRSVVESWDGADPSWHGVEDYGTPDRHPSRVEQLSVKRYGRPREAVGVLAWLALLALGAAVLFFGASASLTGSPLGLVEQLVPLP
jgi:hypothetical protein